MLTCQANKDNYTIAFEGSMTLYSEDSDYHEAGMQGISLLKKNKRCLGHNSWFVV